MKHVLVSSFWFAAVFSFVGGTVFSQESPVPHERLTLRKTIATATVAFAEVRATNAELSAANEGVGLAKKAYLPEGDVYLQWNRATRNNVFGLLFPSGSVPSISGPALDQTTSESTFGSVAAALVRWEAFDFGVRAAGVRREADVGELQRWVFGKMLLIARRQLAQSRLVLRRQAQQL